MLILMFDYFNDLEFFNFGYRYQQPDTHESVFKSYGGLSGIGIGFGFSF